MLWNERDGGGHVEQEFGEEQQERGSLRSATKQATRSLWNRSKRALRKDTREDEGVDEDDEKGDDSAKSAHAKRREQVRRAQRNHRERKGNYIKSLELELLQLRDNEASAFQEAREIRVENEILRDMLGRYHIAIPPPYVQSPALPGPNPAACTTVTLFGEPGPTQRLRVNLSSPDALIYNQTPRESSAPNCRSLPYNPGVQWESTAKSTNPAALDPIQLPPESQSWTSPSWTSSPSQDSSHSQAHSHSYPLPPIPSQSKPHPNDLSMRQIAIDFVLTLEQPCLEHMPKISDKDLNFGHALTTQAGLLAHAPDVLTPNTTWQMPTVEIETLLELSSLLGLGEGEITPVQAWHRIRSHPSFEKLTMGRLDRLREELRGLIACYGFGAVLEEGVFEDVIAYYLPTPPQPPPQTQSTLPEILPPSSITTAIS